MLEINYNELLKKYNSELFTKIRAFNTDEDHLKFWVPTEDRVESVLNLIDSLKESNKLDFKIIFSKSIFNKKNIDQLNLIFNSIAKYNCTEDINNYIYKFEINKDKLNEFYSKKTKFIAKKITQNTKEVNFVSQIFEKEVIKNYYIKEIENFDFEQFKNFFESNIDLKNEAVATYKFFSSDILNCKLTLKISIPSLFVDDFSFEKKNGFDNDLKWIDNLFKIVKKTIENRPLREVKDHSLIYLICSLFVKMGFLHDYK